MDLSHETGYLRHKNLYWAHLSEDHDEDSSIWRSMDRLFERERKYAEKYIFLSKKLYWVELLDRMGATEPAGHAYAAAWADAISRAETWNFCACGSAIRRRDGNHSRYNHPTAPYLTDLGLMFMLAIRQGWWHDAKVILGGVELLVERGVR